jgi:hypothetical protein
VVPAGHQGAYVETYSVDAIESFDHASAQRYEYVPFATFRHRGGMLRHEAPERYFHKRVRQGVTGLQDTWIILGGHARESMDDLPAENLSLRVTGRNGMLAKQGPARSEYHRTGRKHAELIGRAESGGADLAAVPADRRPFPVAGVVAPRAKFSVGDGCGNAARRAHALRLDGQ